MPNFPFNRPVTILVPDDGDGADNSSMDAALDAKKKAAIFTRPRRLFGRRRLQSGDIFWAFLHLGTRLQSRLLPSTFASGVRAVNAIDDAEPQAGYTSEYVEIDFDAKGKISGYLQTIPFYPGDPYTLSTQHLQVAPFDEAEKAKIKDWDRLILGAMGFTSDETDLPQDALDPFGKSMVNGTRTVTDADGNQTIVENGGRMIPNCYPVWYGRSDQQELAGYTRSYRYPNEVFDIEIYKVDPKTSLITNIERFVNARAREIVADLAAWWYDPTSFGVSNVFLQTIWNQMTKLANTKWSFREPKAEEAAQERWNDLNKHQSGLDISREARMNFTGTSGKYQVKLDSKLYHESFDTADTTNFKVTRMPYFDAPEEIFELDYSKQADYYLKPSWLAFMRKFAWSAGRKITYETYRGSYYAQSPRVNLQDGIGYANGSYYFQNNPNFDPEAGPFEFTGTFHIDRQTGAGHHTTHDGEINFQCELGSDYDDPEQSSYTLYYLYKGPNYSVGFLEYVNKYFNNVGGSGTYRRRVDGDWNDGNYPGRYEDGECSLTKAWQFKQMFPSIFGTVYRGVHIGQLPVFPRSTESRWNSVLSYLGEDPYEYDDDNGNVYPYDPEVAAAMPGSINFVVNSFFMDAYNRHASKDATDYLTQIQPMTASVPAQSGQTTTRLATAVGPSNASSYPSGSGLPFWAAQTDAAAEDLRSQIDALPHIRNATVDASYKYVNFRDLNAVDILPIDVEAELLCAVIVQGATKFFIWRKTAEERGGFDYDRNQAVW